MRTLLIVFGILMANGTWAADPVDNEGPEGFSVDVKKATGEHCQVCEDLQRRILATKNEEQEKKTADSLVSEYFGKDANKQSGSNATQ